MWNEDEADLIVRCQQGDTEAFNLLVERYETRIYNFAYCLTRSYDDAQGIAQEVFSRAWTNIHRFHGESSFLTWLTRITRRLYLNVRKDQEQNPGKSIVELMHAREPMLFAEAVELPSVTEASGAYPLTSLLNHILKHHNHFISGEKMESLNIYFTGKEQVEVRQEPVKAPGPGEILVRANCSLISTGIELICYGRRFAPGTHWHSWVQYPFPPGYSHVGTVVEVGQGVEEITPGARVASRSPHHQYATFPASRALVVPDGVRDEDAAWFGIASIVQNGVRRAQHELGDVVVVIGLGILGQLVVQYTKLMGAKDIIAIDLSETRLQAARDHGATHTLCLSVEEALPEVSRLTDGRLADCVYDVTGFAPVFAHALGLTRNLGKVVLLGDSGTPGEQRLASDLIRKGIRVIGAHEMTAPGAATDHAWWTSTNMQKLFFQYVERGQMRVGDLVSRRFAPQDASTAYAQLLEDRSNVLGVLFDWSGAGCHAIL